MGKATAPRKAAGGGRAAALLGLTEVERRSVLARQQSAVKVAVEPPVNDFAKAHGVYDTATVVDLSGELGGKRMSMVKVLLNRGGTAVDRWIARDDRGLFSEPQQQAIRYCRALWARAEGLSAIDPTADKVDSFAHVEGWAQQEALDMLARFKERIPRPFWEVYENVCRFDEEAGRAGSSIASNSRSAIDAAKTTVAFCASLIAQWERL